MFRRFLSALMVLLLCGVIDAAAQEASVDRGVLLGLRILEPIPKPLPYYATTEDSTARSTYQTLLVVRNDTTFRVAAAPDELVIPRTNRLWRAGVKRSIYNNWVEDFVWAAPTGTLPEWSGIQPYNGEYCEGHRVQDVLYAGPSYLALEQRSSGYCEGAAHPWLFNTLAVVPIDSVTHTGLEIDQVLGSRLRRLSTRQRPTISRAFATRSDARASRTRPTRPTGPFATNRADGWSLHAWTASMRPRRT